MATILAAGESARRVEYWPCKKSTRTWLRAGRRHGLIVARSCRLAPGDLPMHLGDRLPPPTRSPAEGRRPWWRELTRYHWFVFIVASLGWLFDTMDQQLFNLARKPAITQLLDASRRPGDAGMVDEYGGYATSIFMIGWAIGGLVFGILGDRIGRAKTMLLTILLLLGVHRPERPLDRGLGLRLLPLPDRPGRRRRVRRGRVAGGRGDARPRPAVRAWAGSRRSRRSAT